MKPKIWFIMMLVLLMAAGLLTFATIDSQIDENKQELERVKNLLQNVDKDKQNNKKQQTTVEKNINSLETTIRQLEDEIDGLETSISQSIADIDVKIIELAEAEKNIQLKNQLMNNRLVVMYKSGNIGYLEVMLGAEDFADLLSRMDALSMIFEHDKDLLAYLKEQRDIIIAKKLEIETKKAELEAFKSDREKKKLEHKSTVNVSGEKQKELEANAVVVDLQVDE